MPAKGRHRKTDTDPKGALIMIRIGKYPEGITADEVNEYVKAFREMHPDIEDGILSIIFDGEYADLYLTDAEEIVPFQRIRRITGYLTGDIRRWNDAKYAELKDRVKHGI
jgi:hypothetical protein